MKRLLQDYILYRITPRLRTKQKDFTQTKERKIVRNIKKISLDLEYTFEVNENQKKNKKFERDQQKQKRDS